jgi:hypothetical protein
MILCLTVAFGFFLYTKTIPMTFKVSLAYGLELWDSAKATKIESISWNNFTRGQTQTQTFYIKNVGNKNANVTLVLGVYDTSAWLITHNFANQTVLIAGFSSAFTISIREINAIGEQNYGCDLAFKIYE